MKFTNLFTAAFVALVAASPVEIAKRTAVQTLATFDDLKAVPAISQINPVGNYKGLNYRSFNVLQPGVLGVVQVAGIKPQSSPNVAANSITGTVLTGSPALIVNSQYTSFDLQSLYLACVVNSASSVAGVPQQCTIAFTAYKAGSKTAFQTINKQFDPTNAVLSNMVKTTFPSSWNKLQRVEVAAVQATSTEPLNAVFIDSVSYKLNK